MRAILLAATVGLTSCSAMILSVGGREETSMVDGGFTKEQVIRQLGAPTESTTLSPPVAPGDLRAQGPGVELLVEQRRVEDPAGGIREVKPRPAVLREQYVYEGRVQEKHDVGEAVALAGYTLFLSEVVMVPWAIKRQFDRSHTVHRVKVWYDDTGTAVAYDWHSEQRK